MNFKETSSLLSCVLGLKRQVVAIDLAEDETEFVDWPIPTIKHRLTFCMMVRLASMGYQRKALGEHFRCRGSAETFRFIDQGDQAHTGERMYRFGLYADTDTAKLAQSSMPRLEKPCYGVAVLPLADCVQLPASVLFIVDAYQAMRLVQAWAYYRGPLKNSSLIGNRGICSECVAGPLISGELHLSPLCANTRYLARWTDGELGVGLPGSGLTALAEGLIATITAVEPGRRKSAIVQRCSQAGITLSLPPKEAYFTNLG